MCGNNMENKTYNCLFTLGRCDGLERSILYNFYFEGCDGLEINNFDDCHFGELGGVERTDFG